MKLGILLATLCALSACAVPFTEEQLAEANVGYVDGNPTYEFLNSWDTRPLPSRQKDMLLRRKAKLYCEDYVILSRTPLANTRGPVEKTGPIIYRTTFGNEKVHILCP